MFNIYFIYIYVGQDKLGLICRWLSNELIRSSSKKKKKNELIRIATDLLNILFLIPHIIIPWLQIFTWWMRNFNETTIWWEMWLVALWWIIYFYIYFNKTLKDQINKLREKQFPQFNEWDKYIPCHNQHDYKCSPPPIAYLWRDWLLFFLSIYFTLNFLKPKLISKLLWKLLKMFSTFNNHYVRSSNPL